MALKEDEDKLNLNCSQDNIIWEHANKNRNEGKEGNNEDCNK